MKLSNDDFNALNYDEKLQYLFEQTQVKEVKPVKIAKKKG
jgi:hypothetical protein